jgi:hypothetical protein
MLWFSIAVALLVAIGIIVLGAMYLFNPRGATQSFGLPLPEPGANVGWWLRLKGTRDIVSGLVLLTLVILGAPRLIGIVLLIQALIPAGDMTLVLASKGSTKAAFGIHGLTVAFMILAAIPLILGVA